MQDAVVVLRDAEPEIPDALSDRAADSWEPLLAIADLAGGDWPERARRAALTLSAGPVEEDGDMGLRLLADCRVVFDTKKVSRIKTRQLIKALAEEETMPWGDFAGTQKRITAHGLAKLLQPFGIRPSKWRQGIKAGIRGYERASFEEPWERYLSVSSSFTTTSETPQPPQSSQDAAFSHFSEPPQNPFVADAENGANADGTRVVADVAVQTPVEGGKKTGNTDGEASNDSAKPCRACGGGRFWSQVPGHLCCAGCHPPGDEAPVRLWWVRRTSGRWLALRPPGQGGRFTVRDPGQLRGGSL
jgi:hypothetical protein